MRHNRLIVPLNFDFMMSSQSLSFDVIIVGAGPGGYVSAIRAGQLGLNVAVVDARDTPGGTCLNVGCIPSKALLHTAHHVYDAQHRFAEQGIHIQGLSVSVSDMIAHKDKVVHALTQGVQFLLKKNKVTVFKGHAAFHQKGSDAHIINVTHEAESHTLSAHHIILATGSIPTHIPNLPFDENKIVSSTGALSFQTLPKHLVVIGGGYIGLELGSAWKDLGCDVTVIESASSIIPAMDSEIQRGLLKALTARGMQFKLNCVVEGVEIHDQDVTLTLNEAGQTHTLICDKVLVSVGRRPYTEGLNLERVGIQTDERGFIRVNASYETDCAGVYAIGDVVGGMMLAHKAEEEGIALIEAIHALRSGALTTMPSLHQPLIPAVIFTQPEVACVGLSENQARAIIEANTNNTPIPQGLLQKGQVKDDLSQLKSIRIGIFPFSANSLSKATGQTEGFVKIITDEKNDRVIGAHILGAHAGALIAEITTAMEFYAQSEDIARICHAHPTMSEAVKEAAWATFAKALHS